MTDGPVEMTGRPRYLLVCYLAERHHGPPTSPGYVAAVLDRSPAATTEQLQRLAADGLVEYEPYEGVALTEEGRATARDLLESYVTLATFFRDVLVIESYETEALRLVGTVSSSVADRLAETLLDDEDRVDPRDSPLFLPRQDVDGRTG